MVTIHIHIGVSLLCFVGFVAHGYVLEAADKRDARLFVKDALTSPNHTATVEARLVAGGMAGFLGNSGLGGEPLELVIDGKVVATAMTGGDGKALLSYTPKAKGLLPILVRVGMNPRVTAPGEQAILAVWERRHPILMVEMASLMEEMGERGPFPGIGLKIEAERKPLLDSAEVLGKLTKFYYRVIYVLALATSRTDGFRETVAARTWLAAHDFPSGYVLVLPPGEDVLGARIDVFHAEGWSTIKTGIGRSKTFAEAFLKRRLNVVMVPEPVKGDAPRKAKVAKEWKEVRKKL